MGLGIPSMLLSLRWRNKILHSAHHRKKPVSTRRSRESPALGQEPANTPKPGPSPELGNNEESPAGKPATPVAPPSPPSPPTAPPLPPSPPSAPPPPPPTAALNPCPHPGANGSPEQENDALEKAEWFWRPDEFPFGEGEGAARSIARRNSIGGGGSRRASSGHRAAPSRRLSSRPRRPRKEELAPAE